MSRVIALAALAALVAACTVQESKTPARLFRDKLSTRGYSEARADVAVSQAQASGIGAPAAPADPFGRITSATALSAMIIRTGQVAVEVDSLPSAIARVRALAERVGGYIANTEIQTG